MTTAITPAPKLRFTDSSGVPLVGAKLFTYAAGTTTKQATYTDSTGGTPNTNPVILDSRGEAVVWLPPGQLFKYTLAPSTDTDPPTNPFWTVDQLGAFADPSGILYPSSGTQISLSTLLKSGLGRVVDSIAALRALLNTSYTRALVTGYTTAGDGGGGVYYYDPTDTTSTDNSGTIIVAGDGGRWKLQQTGYAISVKIFGAKGDGTTDDTAAMSAAHATGALIYYPPGTYKFSTLTFAKGGIIGAGRSLTLLSTTDTGSGNTITYTGANSGVTPVPTFRDFAFSPSGTKTGGNGLSFLPSSGELGYVHMDNVTFSAFPTCVAFNANSFVTVNNCEFVGYTTAGVLVNNTFNPDSGDSVIQGSLFNGTTGVGIIQNASGGLKVIGNKFLAGTVGFGLQFTGSNNTSDLLILGNSFENMTAQDISLARTSGTFNFSNIVICGNQFGVGTTSIQTDGTGFLSELTITGNVFNLSSGTGFGINLGSGSDFIISSNIFRGNGGTPSGIIINAACVNGKIGPNLYSNLSTTVNNASSTTFVTRDTQSGTLTTPTTGWIAYGALFQVSFSVTFPTAFTVAPAVQDIQITPASTNGTLSAVITSVSTTGFSGVIVSAVNSIAAQIGWKASGVI